MDDAFTGYVRYLENLTPKTLNQISKYVTNDVHFKDPFNDVNGIEEMKGVFLHMFYNVENIVFKVRKFNSVDGVGFMEWTFSGRLQKKQWVFMGASVVSFNDNNLVLEHIDYWDAAQGLYENLPVIGWFLRRLRRRLAAC